MPLPVPVARFTQHTPPGNRMRSAGDVHLSFGHMLNTAAPACRRVAPAVHRGSGLHDSTLAWSAVLLPLFPVPIGQGVHSDAPASE